MSRNIHGREVVYTTERRAQAENPGQGIRFSVKPYFVLSPLLIPKALPDLSKPLRFFRAAQSLEKNVDKQVEFIAGISWCPVLTEDFARGPELTC